MEKQKAPWEKRALAFIIDWVALCFVQAFIVGVIFIINIKALTPQIMS